MSDDEKQDPIDWWGAQGPSRASLPSDGQADVPPEPPTEPSFGTPEGGSTASLEPGPGRPSPVQPAPYQTVPYQAAPTRGGLGSAGILVAVVVALLVVVALIVAALVLRPGLVTPTPVSASTTPVPASSPSSVGQVPSLSSTAPRPADLEVVDGRVHLPEGFSFLMPEGFEVVSHGDGHIVRIADDVLTVTVYQLGWFAASDARDRCARELDALQVWVPGTIELLPDVTVGGLTGGGGSLIGDEGVYYEMYCFDLDGVIVNPRVTGSNEFSPEARGLLRLVLESWRWE